MPKKPLPDQLWEITLIGGKRGHVLGTVQALDADEAITARSLSSTSRTCTSGSRLAAQRVE